ncbi:hypothetical protein FKM82_011789 [Ascaphus truei]
MTLSHRGAMTLSLIIKWGGQEFPLSALSEDDTVMDLKHSLKSLTGVLPERQKLLGLKYKGKPVDNNMKLGILKLKPNTKIMMMGTREESLEDVLGPPPDNDEVVNDFDIEEEVVEVENREENLAKISRRVKDYKVELINAPREGKKLLVLDVDYTLFDHRSCAETGLELMRPYLHEFLTSAYEDYDIVIWSATSMKWIEAKMKELGVSTNANYKISFMLDSAAMITVHTPRRGLIDTIRAGWRQRWEGEEDRGSGAWRQSRTTAREDLRYSSGKHFQVRQLGRAPPQPLSSSAGLLHSCGSLSSSHARLCRRSALCPLSFSAPAAPQDLPP